MFPDKILTYIIYTQISKVEELNDVAINVFGYEPFRNKDGPVYKFKGGFYPLLKSRNKKSVNQVDLLLIENSDSESAEFLQILKSQVRMNTVTFNSLKFGPKANTVIGYTHIYAYVGTFYKMNGNNYRTKLFMDRLRTLMPQTVLSRT